ncbi:MAG: cardiolipin synthase [Phycisphaerae bacterium]|jgi:cardiolipin synthase
MPAGLWASISLTLFVLDLLLRVALAVRVISKRTPVPDTLTWLVLLLFAPFISWMLYALMGERRLGTRRVKRFERNTADLELQAVRLWAHQHLDWCDVSARHVPLSRLLTNMAGMPALAGNKLELIADANGFIENLIADIDRATKHVHLLYYIWEPDNAGTRLADAVIRASERGVPCRVLVDSVGSRPMLQSSLIPRLRAAKVQVVESLPASLLRALFARVDLRNHRKIAVIDGQIAYCGSQNITDENFRPRRIGRSARGPGPWIDASVRVHGPAAQALQSTFMRDWLHDSDEHITDISSFLCEPLRIGDSAVHVIPSGPGPRPDAIHQAFLATLHGAHEEIMMTTPYFVPDEATKGALINAALRGVEVTIVVPEQSDSKLVSAAARSHFEDLMEAGVKIHLHRPKHGMLHAKAATVDRELAVIGSANFDMRSFWLNFEATLFVYDDDFAGELRWLQTSYLTESVPIKLASWKRRPRLRRFWENCAQLAGPLL